MKSVGIVGLGAYVPERVMTNEEWSELVDTSDEWIVARTGIHQRRFADANQTTVDLAIPAAKRALTDAGLEAKDIDEIIVATDTPEVYIPDTAAFIQDLLGAREIPSYDLAGSGCAGFVQALDVARSRALSGKKYVLVIGAELLSRLMNWEDRNTCVLFGDAAGAAVVGTDNLKAEILAVVAGTDGSQRDILGLEAGGTRSPTSPERVANGLHKNIVMHGRTVFKQAVTRMTAAAHEVLDRAGHSIDEVALVVPHQANMRIINAVGRSLGIESDRVFVNVDEYGNTGSASVPLALDQARSADRIRPGNLVLLTTFGAGFHWASALLRF